MNLHYSQTTLTLGELSSSLIPLWIYITLKQDKAGCGRRRSLIPLWIYITLKLIVNLHTAINVLYLYEFTLLSNATSCHLHNFTVLYLYEFTLLSNLWSSDYFSTEVLYLYEFTLLSNVQSYVYSTNSCLIPLWIYITLKPQILKIQLATGM